MFPVVTGRSGGIVSTNETVYSVTLPTGIITGEMLLVVIGVDGAPTLSVGSGSAAGWLLKAFAPSSAADGVLGIFVKIAGASNALNVGSTNSESSAWNSFRIDKHRGTTGDLYTAVASGSAPNYPPPALTPSLGLADYLWVACAASGWGSDWATAGPLGFTDFVNRQAGTASSSGNIATAELKDSVSSKLPGPFTSVDQDYATATIAIPGLAGSSADNGAILALL